MRNSRSTLGVFVGAGWALMFGVSSGASATEVTYLASGSANFSFGGLGGSSENSNGTFEGTVTFDYTAGVLSVLSDTLVTTSGTYTEQPPFGQDPIITDVTGELIGLSGLTLPFAVDPLDNPIMRGFSQGVGIRLIPDNWGADYYSEIWRGLPPITPLTHVLSGFSMTGTEQDLITGNATIVISMGILDYTPASASGGAVLNLSPVPEPTSVCLLLIGAVAVLKRRR